MVAGIPADLIFSGRFAGKSTSQCAVPTLFSNAPPSVFHSTYQCTCLLRASRLSLLNTTVSQLAKSVNAVLTLCYRDIYSESLNDDVGQLQLLTSPLAATDEVLNLYAGGLIPVEIAMPSVLHAIGATKEDIDSAVKQATEQQNDSKRKEDSAYKYTEKDNAINLQMKQVDLEAKKKSIKTSEDSRSDVASSKKSSSDDE